VVSATSSATLECDLEKSTDGVALTGPSSAPPPSGTAGRFRSAATRIKTTLKRQSSQRRRLIVFDFDKTLSSGHVFYKLSGLPKESGGPKTPGPYSLTEHGQVRKVAALGSKWEVEMFGGPQRVATLRSLLQTLSSRPGIVLVILSYGYVAPIRKCLHDLGMLAFFSDVCGKLDEDYVSDCGPPLFYDQEFSRDKLTSDLQGFYGSEESHIRPCQDKEAFLKQYLVRWGAKPQDEVMYIDDHHKDCDRMETFVNYVVRVEAGISHVEAEQILENVGIDPEPWMEPKLWENGCVEPGTALVSIPEAVLPKRQRPRWLRCLCLGDSEDETRPCWPPPPPKPLQSHVGAESKTLMWHGVELTAIDTGREITSHVSNRRSSPHKDSFVVERSGSCEIEEGASSAAVVGSMQPRNSLKSNRAYGGCVTTPALIHNTVGIRGGSNFREEYAMTKELGKGAFGTAFRAIERKSKRVVVVKVMKNGDTSDYDQLVDKTHPHIVRVFDCFKGSKGKVHIVMEYCQGGDLFDAMWRMARKELEARKELGANSKAEDDHDGSPVSPAWCAHICRDVMKGLDYLHKTCKQLHNDLKPENILLEKTPTDTSQGVRAMIADFGLASCYGQDTPVGDPRYMDPQVMCFQKAPTFASDVWSLGVTLFELTSGKLPFLNKKNVKGWDKFSDPKLNYMHVLSTAWCRIEAKELKEPDCSKIPNLLARSLAKSLLQVDLSKRESLEFALDHPFTHLGDVLHLKADGGEDHNLTILAHVAHGKAFKLREVLLELVESKLQGEELDYYTELFDEVDHDNDGKLSVQEFTAWWDTVPGIGKPSVEEVLPNVDLDGDGFIEFNEFTALNFDARLLGKNTEKILHSAFDSIAGSDGQIHVEDLQGLVSKSARPFVKHLVEEMDSDKDGRVCYKEFTDYLLDLSKPDLQVPA